MTPGTQSTVKRVMGGSFLIDELTPEEVFTPDDFTDEQRQIEAKEYEVSKKLMRELGELGLLGVDVPEEFGGLELDKVTSAIVSQNIATVGSFVITFSGHVGIGTLPLVWYGTPEQKKKYLDKLATGEWIAAYALSESSAGSDAMNIRTSAKLSEDGKHYLLNGEKMWISNAKKLSLFASGVASQRFATDLADQQEVMGALADMLIEVLVLESTVLRTQKMAGHKPLAVKLTKLYATRSFRNIEACMERVLGAVAEGDMLRTYMTIFRRLSKHEPQNMVLIGREISDAMVEAAQFTV
jgi:alkylation response protein AidB-like acyl-CoA dehydrogenase